MRCCVRSFTGSGMRFPPLSGAKTHVPRRGVVIPPPENYLRCPLQHSNALSHTMYPLLCYKVQHLHKEERMSTSVDIGTLIARAPQIHAGRPHIAGTGVTVGRIVRWYKMGLTPARGPVREPASATPTAAGSASNAAATASARGGMLRGGTGL